MEVGRYRACPVLWLTGHWDASWVCGSPLPAHLLPPAARWESGEFKSRLPHSVPQGKGLGPEAWACLPGQGLRYLEHLCLVLEQVARLQQLHLQLQTQRPPGVSELRRGQAGGWAREWGAQEGGSPDTRISCRTV